MGHVVGCAVLALLAIWLGACSQTTQLSSGQAYLDRYERAAGQADPLNEEIRAAAAVEPILTFPARIGLARIENGQLTPIPQAEADHWIETAERLGPKFGEFVPVSPLIATLAAGASADYRYDARVEAIVHKIRLGAARQHADAVLIYEVSGKETNESTPLSVADLTIIGMFLMPSRTLEANGVASALLLDVRNGYPYGTATATAEDSGFSTLVGSDERAAALGTSARTKAAIALTGEVEAMARALYLGILEKKVAATDPQPAQAD